MKFQIINIISGLTAYLCLFSAGDTLLSWHFFLKKDVSVTNAFIKAGDIGNIYGTDLTQQKKIEIQDTILSENPFVDTKWKSEYIRAMLEKKYIFPESIRGTEIQISIPSHMYSIQEMEEILLGAYSGFLSNDYMISVKNQVSLPANIPFKIKVDLTKIPGEKTANVLLETGSFEKKIKISYTLLKKYTMIQAVKDLEYGDRLTHDNIRKTSMWLDHTVDSVFQVIPLGYVTLRKIPAGMTILSNDVVKKIDVNNGETIALEYSSGNLFIQSTVRACESGSIGEVIKFRNTKNKYIYGEIISKERASFVKGAF